MYNILQMSTLGCMSDKFGVYFYDIIVQKIKGKKVL